MSDKNLPANDERMLLEQGRQMVARAIQFEQSQQLSIAHYYYVESWKVMTRLYSLTNNQVYQTYMEQYRQRADTLAALNEENLDRIEPEPRVDPGMIEMARAKTLLVEALDLDEGGQQEEALAMYTEAVDTCLQAKKNTSDKHMQDKLGKVAIEALERAETLKTKQQPIESSSSVVKSVVRPLGNLLIDKGEFDGGGRTSADLGYTDEERKALSDVTAINGIQYLPFVAADLRERFAFPIAYTDPHGKLTLSAKQKQKLKDWARPDEFMADPQMLQIVDCYSVKQTLVSDCSFVASIAIAAQYEKKYKKKLITSIIYPQNKKGEPVYNPCGKYMIKLHLNGIQRKVIVDDYFPLGARNEMLSSYSSNKSELWISVLEKAYMKVMGGYDFPGSNSNIDLYALTGWVPERIAMRPGDPTFNAEAVFDRLHDRFHRGEVLATAATGELSDSVADNAGLVSTHAYAVLDVRKVKDEKLLLLKNPWAHLRWRGNWSELDTRNWTKEFQNLLNYNPDDAVNFDNGVFWIDYKSMQKYFDVLYLNWNPELFSNTFAIHQLWKSGSGPAKDIINIGENPQFSLEMRDCSAGGAVWLLLSRHITDIQDFRNNKEYITLLVYKNNGKRVYYPFDPAPFIDGVRINSPHYLTKIVLPKGESVRRFTLVVSQFEKTTAIYFTVRAYSNQPFTLDKVKNPYRHKTEVTGKWSGRSAGGCANNKDTWPNNPRYKLVIDTPSKLQIQLKGPRTFQIGFDLLCISASDTSSPHYAKKKSSGVYRPGFVVCCMDVVAGTYDLLPSTYRPGEEAPFFLTAACSGSFQLTK